MKFRRWKVIANPRHSELLQVIDAESGDPIYGVTGVRWATDVGDECPSVTICFAADMIDFEISKPTPKAERE